MQWALSGGANTRCPVCTTYYATSAFGASELLLSIRIYEPFRNWR
jgi:hypothetical protein